MATDRVGQVAYFVALEDGSPISFAALWEHWGKSNNALESFNNHYDDSRISSSASHFELSWPFLNPSFTLFRHEDLLRFPR